MSERGQMTFEDVWNRSADEMTLREAFDAGQEAGRMEQKKKDGKILMDLCVDPRLCNGNARQKERNRVLFMAEEAIKHQGLNSNE